MQARWRLVRRLVLIFFIGCVLTLVSTRFILLAEEQTIRQRLSDDSRQVEHQLRQMMLNYAFATEWTARSLEVGGIDYAKQLSDEAASLFLYYPSLQRILVFDTDFNKQFERYRDAEQALPAQDFSTSIIAENLRQEPALPHAQSAPAQNFSKNPADIVIALPFTTAEHMHYLILVVNIHKLFDQLIRQQITEGYQVAVKLNEQTIYRFAGTDALRDKWLIERPLVFAINTWELELWPTAAKLADMYSASAKLVFFGGLLLTAGGLVLGWRSHRLHKAVKEHHQEVKQLRKRLKNMHATEAQLVFLSDHDAQTELPNKNGLAHHLEGLLERCATEQKNLSLLIISIDSLAELNHALGHPVGDEIIQRIAQRINKAVPASVFLARTNIDTFVAVNTTEDWGHLALDLARTIREAIRPQLFIDEHEIYCSASIGIALAKDANYQLETLLHNADAAHYKAKQQGFFGIEQYQPEQRHALGERRERLHALRIALDKQELELNYQPIIQLRNQRAEGVEGLIRWRTKTGHVIEPQQFLHLMEQTGLIFSLTEFAIRTACQQLKQWHSKGIEQLTMSLNFSLRQLTMPELPQLLEQHIKRAQLAPEHVQLDINEAVFLQLCQHHHSTLDCFKKLGVRLCVNLLGVSHQLLQAMERCTPQVFKIAPELIAEIPNDVVQTELVESIIRLAQNSHCQVIAVAVEHQQQIDFLKQRNCYLAQGNLLAPPLTAAQLGRLLDAPFVGQQPPSASL
ncbi:bifunctional diguanylate cyclase/phosphodiesterase [Pseudidiomarina sp. CB1]|uniref:putative bifunctional diguanylate cyclase/phosphodiesterase n=1 Tax=Pseudidiomarina sp. CB1 TaxID=2972484 RepID=UPI0021616FB1|nr:bifunctional diguanylate cyclase/phosphodiesterase [Pseudidiomarina sp. CB1]